MRALLADVRFALRMLARNPGSTAVAVLSLAIAIGPNATLFSLFDRTLLHAAPLPASDRLFYLHARSDAGWESLSYLDYLDLRRQSATAVGILAYEKRGVIWNTGGQSEVLPVNIVSENYFSVLGVNAALGRAFVPGLDERFEGAPPVVMSHSLWQRRFASDPAVVGQTMLLNGRSFLIAGVAARGFRGLAPAMPNDLWVTFGAAPVLYPGEDALLARRDKRGILTVVRLRPGVAAQQAEAEMSGLVAALAEAYPATNKCKRAALGSLDEGRRGPAVAGILVLSLVSLVLLIACANVAGIRLAQGEARRKEMALRAALGAGRARLVRQLLVEGLLLSLAAAALGLLMAHWLVNLLPALKPPSLAFLSYEVGLDGRVAVYTLMLATAATLGFGLIPAWRASRPDVLPALKGEYAGGRRRMFSLRALLVVGQIAAAQFLLAGAGLLLRSYFEYQAIRPGFDPHKKLLLITVVPEGAGAACNFGDLAAELRALPGVRRVSFSKKLPMSGTGEGRQEVTVPGVTEVPVAAGWNAVGPEYFVVMGTRILRGRDLGPAGAGKEALVNLTMARQLWGTPEAALGAHFRMKDEAFQIVGVVEDGKYRSLTESPMPYVFLPASPGAMGEGSLLVETDGEPGALAPAVRKALLAAQPHLVIFNLSTLRQHLGYALFAPRMAAGLVATIGLMGIFLASIGLYGVVSHSVSRRTREIGVRVALGAQPGEITRLVLRMAVWMVAAGAAAGTAATLMLARAFSAGLYNIGFADPPAYCGGIGLVLGITLLASYAPTRRALRVDPATVLRQE